MPTRNVGLLLDPVGSHGRGVLHGIASYAHAHGPWNLTMHKLWHFAPPSDFRTWKVDGYIAYILNDDAIHTFKSLKKPVINISSRLANTPFPSVVTDNTSIGQKVADYFLAKNFKHIAFAGFSDTYYSNLRGQAFAQRILDAQLPIHCTGLQHTFTPPGAITSHLPLADFLRQLPKPAALMACVDSYAADILTLATQQLHLAVPEQLAIVGVGNDELFNKLANPPLSSLATDDHAIGYHAAQLLDQLLAGKKTPASPILIPPREVVTRQSSDILAIDDPLLAQAVKFIRENVSRPLGIQDVLDEVATSRRPMEKRFKASLHRTILQEIHRTKIDRAKELLQNNALSIHQIARHCGFKSATRLGIIFRKLTRTTPNAYRKNKPA